MREGGAHPSKPYLAVKARTLVMKVLRLAAVATASLKRCSVGASGALCDLRRAAWAAAAVSPSK